jgi:hypothetical protein
LASKGRVSGGPFAMLSPFTGPISTNAVSIRISDFTHRWKLKKLTVIVQNPKAIAARNRRLDRPHHWQP